MPKIINIPDLQTNNYYIIFTYIKILLFTLKNRLKHDSYHTFGGIVIIYCN